MLGAGLIAEVVYAIAGWSSPWVLVAVCAALGYLVFACSGSYVRVTPHELIVRERWSLRTRIVRRLIADLGVASLPCDAAWIPATKDTEVTVVIVKTSYGDVALWPLATAPSFDEDPTSREQRHATNEVGLLRSAMNRVPERQV